MNQVRNTAPGTFISWYRGHLRAMREGVRMPLTTPLNTLFTIITLSICFYLPLITWVLWQNFADLQAGWDQQGSIAVFMQADVELREVGILQQELKESRLIADVTLSRKDELHAQLMHDPQLNKVIDIIESHQLPHQLFVKPVPDATQAQLEAFAAELSLNPQVEYVSYDASWFSQLDSVTNALYYLMQASIFIFLIIVLVILSNTIANEVADHQKEIRLTHLLGATQAQIRRRFLYGGIYYGVLATALALLLLNFTLWWIAEPVQQLARSFATEVQLKTLDWHQLLTFLLIAVLITWTGSRLALQNHIKKV